LLPCLFYLDPKRHGSNWDIGVTDFAWVAGRKAIATAENRLHGSGYSRIGLTDLAIGKPKFLTPDDENFWHSPFPTPEGNLSWIGSNWESTKICIYDGTTTRSIYTEPNTRLDNLEAWSPDGKRIIASYGNDLIILDAANGKVLHIHPDAWSAFWLNSADFLYAGAKGIYSYRLGDPSGKLIVPGGNISPRSRILLKEQLRKLLEGDKR